MGACKLARLDVRTALSACSDVSLAAASAAPVGVRPPVLSRLRIGQHQVWNYCLDAGGTWPVGFVMGLVGLVLAGYGGLIGDGNQTYEVT